MLFFSKFWKLTLNKGIGGVYRLGMPFVDETFSYFHKKSILPKKSLYQNKALSEKNIFLSKKERLQKLSIKMNILYKKRKIISCFL